MIENSFSVELDATQIMDALKKPPKQEVGNPTTFRIDARSIKNVKCKSISALGHSHEARHLSRVIGGFRNNRLS